MDFDIPQPRLEKRLMPLLDVALTLVGMLIVLLAIASQDPSTGVEGDVLSITANRNGIIEFDGQVLFDGVMNGGVLQQILDLVKSKDKPLVLFHFFYPESGETTALNEAEVEKMLSLLYDEGVSVRLIGRP